MSTTETSADTTIDIRKVIQAPRERVYAAFTTPELAKQWWSGDGWTHTELILDARPGGTWRFQMCNDETGQTFTSEGTYLEAVEPERLVWTNSWEGDGGVRRETRVTVTFAVVEGGTEVHVVQEFFPDQATRDAHAGGWGGCLEQLGTLLH